MNYAYLLDHIARDFYTNVRLYDNNGRQRKLVRPDDRLNDDALEALILKTPLVREASLLPLIFTVNHHLHYALVRIPEGLFLLGPVLFITMLPVKRDISADPGIVNNLLPIIPVNTPDLCIDRLLTLSNVNRTGEKDEPFYTVKDIYDENLISDPKEKDSYETLYGTIFENVEQGFTHNPYNHEHRERTCIQNGDVDGLKEVLKERFPGRYGRLSKDPVRQEIYMGIVSVSIACRAAIDGGLHPETAFYLSDVTINKLDECKDAVSPLRISQNAEIQYATLVQEMNEKQEGEGANENRHISHCKDYVFAHLHGKLTVQEIADAIGLEPNYLSSLFKKCQGVSLKQYIRHQKIKLVKNLLTYSSYTYSEIAAYLGFASQSHMGQDFKKETGITPRVFRERNASEDFMNDTISD